ncbi:myogenesis-regulating glycosidase [Strongylocentrotus purpuratus]|uniref:Myogenesis-regulating glycosidase n=1 Tax=Strongylocentrotus purpuratus TaxID=7668 RepID=A0A7M7RC35_STRPU|nr:myogenesis-regulating glycosidase [Strongylocentrotus purpuratus]
MMDGQSENQSTKKRGMTRFQVDEVQESNNGNGHSLVNLDEVKTSCDDGMTPVDLRSRTNSVVDPAVVDISHPIKALKIPRELWLKIFVVLLFVLIVIGTTCILLFYSEPPLHYKVGRLLFYVDTKTVRVSYRGSNYTHSSVGLNLPLVTPSTCAATTDRRLCLEWREYGQLEIDWLELDNMDCYEFAWTAIHQEVLHKDCFSFQNAHWYGGAVIANQQWPIEVDDMPSQPFLSGDGSSPFGPVLERYWLSSNGLGLRVNDSVFISMSMDSERQEMCLESGQYDISVRSNTSEYSVLQYTMCLASDLTAVHRNMSDKFIVRTKNTPDSNVITNPTWTVATPADKALWNDSSLITTANTLHNLGYTSGLFEIPSSYEAVEGDLVFDGNRFRDVSTTMTRIQDLGFTTAVQVTPYVSTQSKSFVEGVSSGYWVNDPRDLVPGLTKWGDNVGAALDVSSSSAVQWFKSKLKSIRASGVDAFTFDYGQASYLPVGFQVENTLEIPDEYATRYAIIASEMASPLVRCVYQCQNIPLVAELITKDPTWDGENGLKTIIPTALTMGLQGYPYFMPDLKFMEDGCAQPQDCLPSKELFIRYIELTAFLPAMHIPTILSEYDEETRSIVQKWVKFHRDEIAQLVLDLAQEFSQKGDPVIRPLWWSAPTDTVAFRINSQFMVGDDLLVAPILDQGATQRHVYLPAGTWVDKSKQQLSGEQWLNDVSVLLGDVAYYRRVQ